MRGAGGDGGGDGGISGRSGDASGTTSGNCSGDERSGSDGIDKCGVVAGGGVDTVSDDQNIGHGATAV